MKSFFGLKEKASTAVRTIVVEIFPKCPAHPVAEVTVLSSDEQCNMESSRSLRADAVGAAA